MVDLSIVVALRNDYYDNQAYRIRVFLRALDILADRYGLTAEIVAVEWNPIPGPSLKEMLHWPDNARIITVPPEIHQRYENSKAIDFYQMIAKNVGIRRARGEWILATNPDVIFSEDLVAYLAAMKMHPGKLYRAFRHDLGTTYVEGFNIAQNNYNIAQVLDYCRRNVVTVHSSKFLGLHTHACGDFTMLHRDAWADLRGYPELDLWSIHVDSVFACMADVAGYKEVVLPDGCCVYHIEHAGSWVVNRERALALPHLDITKDVIPMFQSMRKDKSPLKVNGPNWGLWDDQLVES